MAMCFLTPLQTLTFYNAIANGGTMVKPRFIREVRAIDQTVKVFEEIINLKYKPETIKKLQALLKNVVENHGTARGLFSENF